jgi:hypothetical protein
VKRLLHLIALLLFAAMATYGQTVSVSGTVVAPSGSSFGNGRFLVQMPNPGVQNTCVTPSVVVPTTSLIVPITNGAFSATLIATDCLSKFIPYRVTLQNSYQAVISTNYWYVSQVLGAAISQSSGSKYIYPAGLAGFADNLGVFAVPQTIAGFQFVTAAETLSATKTFTFNWPSAFTDANYVTVCSFLNPNGSLFFYFVYSITTQTTSSFKVTVEPSGSTSTVSGKLVCFAREPQ